MPVGLLWKARSPLQTCVVLASCLGWCSAAAQWEVTDDLDGTVQRVDISPQIEGDKLFMGACEVGNYQIVFPPYNGEVVGIWDEVESGFRIKDVAEYTGVVPGKYYGCATDKYGRAVMAPHSFESIGIFTPWLDTLDLISPKSLSGGGPYFCGVIRMPSDKLFFVPWKTPAAMILDVDDPSNVQEVAIQAQLNSNTPKFCGGVVHQLNDQDAGQIYLAPQDLDEIGIFTISNDGYRGHSIAVSPYTRRRRKKFNGAAITSHGKIVFAPDSSEVIMVFDTVSKTTSHITFDKEDGRQSSSHDDNWHQKSQKFSGAILNHYDRVVLVPYLSCSVWVVDAETETLMRVRVEKSKPNQRGWFGGGVAGPNGKLFFPPHHTLEYLGIFTSPRNGDFHSCVDWAISGETGTVSDKTVEQCAVAADQNDMEAFAVGDPGSFSDNKVRCLLLASQGDFSSKTAATDSDCLNGVYYLGTTAKSAVYVMPVTTTSTTTTSTTTTSTTITTTTTTNTTTTTILDAIVVDNGGGASSVATIIVGVVGGIIFCIIVGFFAYEVLRHHKKKWSKKELRMPWQLPKELYDPDNEESLMNDKFGIDTLLNPPAEITHELADDLSHALKSLTDSLGDLRDFEPEVFLSFANGMRAEDAADTGPGMFHAAAVTKLLFGHGVPVFSTLLVPRPQKRAKSVFMQRVSVAAHVAAQALHIGHDNPHEAFMHRLQKPKKSNLKVLILVESRSIFEEQELLEQIHAATKVDDLTIIRLRFEEELPNADERWAAIRQGSNKNLQKMREAVEESLQTFAPIPKAPGTVPGEAKHLMKMIQMLAGKTNRLVNWHPEHSPWETRNHNHAWVEDWFKEIDFEPPPMPEIEDDEEDEEIHGFFGKLAHGIRKSRATVALSSLRKSFVGSRQSTRSKASGGSDLENQKPRPSAVSTISAKSILKKPSMASGIKRSMKSVLFKDANDLVEVEDQKKKTKKKEAGKEQEPSRISGMFKGWGGMFATVEEETPLKNDVAQAKENNSPKLQKSKTGSTSNNAAKAKSKKKPKPKTKSETMMFDKSETERHDSAKGNIEGSAEQEEEVQCTSLEADNEEDWAISADGGIDAQTSLKGSAKPVKKGRKTGTKNLAKMNTTPQVVGSNFSSADQNAENNEAHGSIPRELAVTTSVVHLGAKKKAKMTKKTSAQPPSAAPTPASSKALDFGNMFAPTMSLASQNSMASGNKSPRSPRAPMEIPKIVVTAAPQEEDEEGW